MSKKYLVFGHSAPLAYQWLSSALSTKKVLDQITVCDWQPQEKKKNSKIDEHKSDQRIAFRFLNVENYFTDLQTLLQDIDEVLYFYNPLWIDIKEKANSPYINGLFFQDLLRCCVLANTPRFYFISSTTYFSSGFDGENDFIYEIPEQAKYFQKYHYQFELDIYRAMAEGLQVQMIYASFLLCHNSMNCSPLTHELCDSFMKKKIPQAATDFVLAEDVIRALMILAERKHVYHPKLILTAEHLPLKKIYPYFENYEWQSKASLKNGVDKLVNFSLHPSLNDIVENTHSILNENFTKFFPKFFYTPISEGMRQNI